MQDTWDYLRDWFLILIDEVTVYVCVFFTKKKKRKLKDVSSRVSSLFDVLYVERKRRYLFSGLSRDRRL